jgi:hypothetical protein
MFAPSMLALPQASILRFRLACSLIYSHQAPPLHMIPLSTAASAYEGRMRCVALRRMQRRASAVRHRVSSGGRDDVESQIISMQACDAHPPRMPSTTWPLVARLCLVTCPYDCTARAPRVDSLDGLRLCLIRRSSISQTWTVLACVSVCAAGPRTPSFSMCSIKSWYMISFTQEIFRAAVWRDMAHVA